jgi:ectoine hydroxylase-related dioxygenase (phytanoyl-CoA dioxygenase family)
VALSDVTEQSGPVRFLRGSHRWGLKNAGDFFHQDIEAQKSSVPVPPGETWDEQAAIIPPGGCSVHHMLTYHGSGPNLSGLPRRSLAIHLRTDRSRVADNVRDLTLEQGRDLVKYVNDPFYNPLIHGNA